MQWWCSAQGTTWTWNWSAYPGVWLLVLSVATGYYLLTRNAGSENRLNVTFGWLGIIAIWLALDWPLGPLAAGYLASAHALQFLLITLIGVPLILLGVKTVALKKLPTRGPIYATIKLLTIPLVAAVVFNAVTIATHSSHVVDTLMLSQLGAFATDLAWFLSAICFWWPIIMPVPARPQFNALWKVLYIFVGTSFHTIIAMIMLISRYPLYSVYELAPPMTGLNALQDMHVAGGIMELIGAAIVFPIMSVIFFRWTKTKPDAAADEQAILIGAELNRQQQARLGRMQEEAQQQAMQKAQQATQNP